LALTLTLTLTQTLTLKNDEIVPKKWWDRTKFVWYVLIFFGMQF